LPHPGNSVHSGTQKKYFLKKTALIPARYAASRLPGKLMRDLGGKTVILRTYEAVRSTGLFDDVIVVCDHEIIYEEIRKHGGKAMMSRKTYECGTDRIAEAALSLPDSEIFVNVQGDEPFTEKEPLKQLLQVFEQEENKEIHVASLMHAMAAQRDVENPNNVKVVVDQHFNALLFSRSVIPYPRTSNLQYPYYKHIGIYAFRRPMLLEFAGWPQTSLEKMEQLENLRILEHGVKMKMVLTDHIPIGIDTEEDLHRALQLCS
jgi:3-deoxy-D-manno-octulosonate cytidylyltransferase